MMEKKKLATYSEMGGYEINYILDGHRLICGDCANALDEEEKLNVEQFILWEGDDMYCDICNKEIETIY